VILGLDHVAVHGRGRLLGRKPGTQVFTVRDAPGGAPTLMLSAEPAKEAA
jgi:hypothetical protein